MDFGKYFHWLKMCFGSTQRVKMSFWSTPSDCSCALGGRQIFFCISKGGKGAENFSNSNINFYQRIYMRRGLRVWAKNHTLNYKKKFKDFIIFKTSFLLHFRSSVKCFWPSITIHISGVWECERHPRLRKHFLSLLNFFSFVDKN